MKYLVIKTMGYFNTLIQRQGTVTRHIVRHIVDVVICRQVRHLK